MQVKLLAPRRTVVRFVALYLVAAIVTVFLFSLLSAAVQRRVKGEEVFSLRRVMRVGKARRIISRVANSILGVTRQLRRARIFDDTGDCTSANETVEAITKSQLHGFSKSIHRVLQSGNEPLPEGSTAVICCGLT